MNWKMSSATCRSVFPGGDGLKKNVISTDSTKPVIYLVYFKEMLKKNIWHNTTSFMYCNQIMTDAVSLLRYDVEQEVDRPVIWNSMSLMWCHYNDNVSKRDFSITNDFVPN